jgi:uncharacterized protein (DUF952 family)
MSDPVPHIFHITTRDQWETALIKGVYMAATQAEEGFMHCSTADQVAGVLERYYAGRSGLVKLKIDPDKLSCPLIYELATSVNQLFPHLYGPLNVNAVVEITEI